MDKQAIESLVQEYLIRFPEDIHALRVLEFLAEYENFWQRENEYGHLTASAWVVNEDSSKILLTHHKKFKMWVQIGGHIEENDNSIAESSARELAEESGLVIFKILQPAIFDIDVHKIPSNHKGFPEHFHFDIRFLFEADDKAILSHQIEESNGVKWVSIDEIMNWTKELSVLRMVEKSSNQIEGNVSRKNKEMKIGITGGIGSGKSLVVDELERLGAKVYRADKRAKELVYLPEIKKQIIAELGEASFEEEKYNTKYVAGVVFNDPNKLQSLNAIIHPAVFRDLEIFCQQNIGKTIVYESALMIETGHTHLFDRVILVTAPLELRIERVMQRDQMDRESVLNRIRKQWPDEKKSPWANILIENINKDKTLDLVKTLWQTNFQVY